MLEHQLARAGGLVIELKDARGRDLPVLVLLIVDERDPVDPLVDPILPWFM